MINSRRHRSESQIIKPNVTYNNNNNNNTGFILHGLARKLYWLKPELIEGLSTVGIVEFWWTLFWWETVGFLPGRKHPILRAGRHLGLNPRPTALCGIPSSANASTRSATEAALMFAMNALIVWTRRDNNTCHVLEIGWECNRTDDHTQFYS